jgi:hypothetical protein
MVGLALLEERKETNPENREVPEEAPHRVQRQRVDVRGRKEIILLIPTNS